MYFRGEAPNWALIVCISMERLSDDLQMSPFPWRSTQMIAKWDYFSGNGLKSFLNSSFARAKGIKHD